MALLKSKQIQKVLAAPVRISGLSSTASDSVVVTTAITTALSTAGDGGTTVPLVLSGGAGQFGVVTGSIVQIFDAQSLKIDDGNGNEVYGRITEAGGVYTLSYFSLLGGTETAFSFIADETISAEFSYRFTFKDLPTDAIVALSGRNVQEDPSVGAGTPVIEQITVTSLNTLANLSLTPNSLPVTLIVNGKEEDSLTGGAFTVSGTLLTWNPSNASYDIQTTDRVVARYYSFA